MVCIVPERSKGLYEEESKCLAIHRNVVFKEMNFKGDESTVTSVDAEPQNDAQDSKLQFDVQDDVFEAELNDNCVEKRKIVLLLTVLDV